MQTKQKQFWHLGYAEKVTVEVLQEGFSLLVDQRRPLDFKSFWILSP